MIAHPRHVALADAARNPSAATIDPFPLRPRVLSGLLVGGSQLAASKLGHDGAVVIRRRRLMWWIGGVVVVAPIAAIPAPFVYIHFIEGPPPAKLALPQSTTTTSGSKSSSTTSSSL